MIVACIQRFVNSYFCKVSQAAFSNGWRFEEEFFGKYPVPIFQTKTPPKSSFFTKLTFSCIERSFSYEINPHSKSPFFLENERYGTFALLSHFSYLVLKYSS